MTNTIALHRAVIALLELHKADIEGADELISALKREPMLRAAESMDKLAPEPPEVFHIPITEE